MSEETPFRIDTPIRFRLGIGLVGCQSETRTVGEWLDITEMQLADISTHRVGEMLSSAWDEWSSQYIDGHWSRED